MGDATMKLAIATNTLAPYRIPLFEAIRKRVDDLLVILMAEREENRQWVIGESGFKTRTLPGIHFRLPGSGVSSHFNHGVLRLLQEFGPDAVISGGFTVANVTAFLYCRMMGRVFLNWGELTLPEFERMRSYRRLIRRLMASSSDGAIASSTDAVRAFLRYGVKRSEVLWSPMPVDVDHFDRTAASYRSGPRFAERRAQYGKPVLLSVGHLLDAKGCPQLFEIFRRVRAEFPDASLILAGDGPERRRYEAYVERTRLRGVHFEGFVQPAELPKLMAMADVFVFPTLFDRYGAVAGEAMAARVLTAASIYAAATEDLIIEGLTGRRIDPCDAPASAAAIMEMLGMSEAAKTRMTEAAYRLVRVFDAEASGESIVRFVERLLMRKKGREEDGVLDSVDPLEGRTI
jgi:glycosyltransferase involved in cell wall biosynthesis